MNFEYFNPNPLDSKKRKNWNKLDCSVRSICCAIGLDWVSAYKELCDAGLSIYDMPDSKDAIEIVLKKYGFEWVKQKKGEKKPYVSDFAKDHKNSICVLSCCGHVLCTKNGKYYDTGDSGNMKVFGWWKKIK